MFFLRKFLQLHLVINHPICKGKTAGFICKKILFAKKYHLKMECYKISQNILQTLWQISCRHSQLYCQSHCQCCHFILFHITRKHIRPKYFKATFKLIKSIIVIFYHHNFALKNICDSGGLGFAEISY